MRCRCSAFHLMRASFRLMESYLLFEKGETAHGTNRIVRVGTHTGNDQLRSRLKQHFLVENKDRSIFRKNIGRALLNKDKDPFLSDWELDLTARKAKDQYSGRIDMSRQRAIEKRVSDYIQSSFSFVVLPVNEKEQRLRVDLNSLPLRDVSAISSMAWPIFAEGENQKIRTLAC